MSDPNTPAGQAAPAPATDEVSLLRAQIAAAEAKYAELRAAYNRRDQEVAAARRQQPPAQTATAPVVYEDPDNAGGGIDPAEFENIRAETAYNRVMFTTPDFNKHRAKFDEILNDPAKAARYAVFDGRGRVNYERAMRDIVRDLELEALRSAPQTPAGQAPAPARPNVAPALTPQHATISGGASSAAPSAIDLDSATPEELLAEMERLGMVDPNDRPGSKPSTSLR